jgi:hypothetical protein
MIIFEYNNNIILNLIIFYLNYNQYENYHIILKSYNITHEVITQFIEMQGFAG